MLDRILLIVTADFGFFPSINLTTESEKRHLRLDSQAAKFHTMLRRQREPMIAFLACPFLIRALARFSATVLHNMSCDIPSGFPVRPTAQLRHLPSTQKCRLLLLLLWILRCFLLTGSGIVRTIAFLSVASLVLLTYTPFASNQTQILPVSDSCTLVKYAMKLGSFSSFSLPSSLFSFRADFSPFSPTDARFLFPSSLFSSLAGTASLCDTARTCFGFSLATFFRFATCRNRR